MHPLRDNFWIPLLLGFFSSVISIPVTIATSALTGLLSQILPAIFGGAG